MSKQIIGIVGGGQLGRMLTLTALPLGFEVIVINPSPNSPAAQVGAKEIVADLYDPSALRELASVADYVTIEIEHLDAKTLETLSDGGAVINPHPRTVQFIQDKLQQKKFLSANNIPVADFVGVKNKKDATTALKTYGGKMLIKTRHGAYDGRGNMVVSSVADIDEALSKFKNIELYAEKFVPFKKELAVIVARAMDGTVATYPVVETRHERNICVEVLSPAQVSDEISKEARQVAHNVAEKLGGAGVFAIEMFLSQDNKILVNEIAPRVHNSGHHTIEGNRTSQFEQHIRAITGLPLGDTSLIVPAAVMVNILGDRDGETTSEGLDLALSISGVSVHLYGKSPTKIDRKMGHITATADTMVEAKSRARLARKHLRV